MSVDQDVATASRARAEPLDVVRLLLGVGWIVVALALLVTGERSASVTDLQEQIADGHVHEVAVSGGLTPGSRGMATQQLRWSRGPLHFYAEVRQRSAGDQVKVPSGDGVPVVHQDVAEMLSNRFPDLEVTRAGTTRYPSGEVAGWSVPTWVGLSVLVLFLMTLGLVISGPQPRRVTRWGWFWLVTMAAPVGLPAYLLLGRPHAASSGSGRDTRMRGLPAFLLAGFVVPACTGLLALAL